MLVILLASLKGIHPISNFTLRRELDATHQLFLYPLVYDLYVFELYGIFFHFLLKHTLRSYPQLRRSSNKNQQCKKYTTKKNKNIYRPTSVCPLQKGILGISIYVNSRKRFNTCKCTQETQEMNFLTKEWQSI